MVDPFGSSRRCRFVVFLAGWLWALTLAAPALADENHGVGSRPLQGGPPLNGPLPQIEPASFNFGDQTVGTSSDPQTVTVRVIPTQSRPVSKISSSGS